MASPPSPKPFSPVTTTASPTKKPQSIPWTHQETVHLIQAYQEKWYSLKRGPLKANQWEEVAVTVAVRCGYDYNEPCKTAIQCRHKMEKLRQRYRAENHRLAASSSGSRLWQYFDLMDQLEKGPMPISAQPLVAFMPYDYDDNEEGDDVDVGDDDDDKYNEIDERRQYSQSRSTNYFPSQRPESKYRGVSEFSREQLAKRTWRASEEEEEEVEENVEEVYGERMIKGMGLVSGLAAEMKAFAERFIGMENLKMEMMKETERCRLEMENKRIEMIVKSQQRIVDSIGEAFGFPKKMKISPEI